MKFFFPQNGQSVIDFGSGSGLAAFELRKNGLNVQMIDIAPNSLNKEIREKLDHNFKFLQSTLWNKDLAINKADYGFCTDVLEHIPEEYVDDVLLNISNFCTKGAVLRICTHHDRCGALIGERLHLSVYPFSWWEDKLKNILS